MPHNRIFLSHRGIDSATVLEYRHVLASAGYRPWMDVTDVPPGPALVRRLQEAMASSCAAVFFVTPHYQDEGYLEAEIDDALRQKTIRGNAFSIITLVFCDERGERSTVPVPLRKYVWREPRTHLEGIRYIIEALPPQISKTRGYLPLHDVVPPTAREVAVVGQNLTSRFGLSPQHHSRFLHEIKTVLSRASLETVVFVMMVPKALLAIHPRAANHLRDYSLPRLLSLHKELVDETRITVAFHPAATLSMIAVDWSLPDSAFALITPKFQRTAQVDDRLSLLLDDTEFDAASMARMLLEANDGINDAITAPLAEAPELLAALLTQAML